jgi:signal transduction histidine kinase
MFNNARIKLTAWYLLIIMFISIFFSLAIYRGVIGEMNRVTRLERFRIQQTPFNQPMVPPVLFDQEIIGEIKRRIIFSLIVINGIILVTAGGLGYFLAGKTLKPIADMVDEQNRFVSDASHELRTPLTSLKTAIEVELRDKKMDLPSAKKLMGDNLVEINRLQSLSEGLLQLTQMENGNSNLKLEKLSLKKIIGTAVKKINIIAREKKITIVNSSQDYKITGNELALTDLLVIVLDNAIKYSGHGKKIIIDTEKKDKKVSLFIKDQGIGIDGKDLPRVFDRFYRAEKARERKGTGGYGLGLAIAKKIVETHHGKIEIESKLDKGTTVIIILPSLS